MEQSVDKFFCNAKTWRDEFTLLRAIILQSGLTEHLKWGKPCYTLDNNNIVLIHGFKEYCALLFHKGALLHDPQAILIQQTENVQAARQIRFTSVHQIKTLRPVLKTYIENAIAVEKAGLTVDFKKTADFPIPPEFQTELDTNPALHKAFFALSPGRQRGYLLYFAAAKQPKTRQSRIEKYTGPILAGKGLDD